MIFYQRKCSWSRRTGCLFSRLQLFQDNEIHCLRLVKAVCSLQFCSFIFQVSSIRRQRRDLCCLRVKLPPDTTSQPLKVEAIFLSALPKDTTSELAGLFSHYPFLMLNVKQWSREAVNTNFSNLLVWLGQGIEFRSIDYEADTLTPDHAPVTFLCRQIFCDKLKTFWF